MRIVGSSLPGYFAIKLAAELEPWPSNMRDSPQNRCRRGLLVCGLADLHHNFICFVILVVSADLEHAPRVELLCDGIIDE